MEQKKKRKRDPRVQSRQPVVDQTAGESDASETPSRRQRLESTVVRPDVSERRKASQAIDIYARKLRLSGICGAEARQFDWDGAIQAMSQATTEAYVLANLYVLRQLEEGRPLRKIDQAFYQTCLSLATNATRSTKGQPRNDLEAAGRAFYKMRSGTAMADTAYLNQSCFSSSALQMATNTQNAIVQNFAKCLYQYVLSVQVEPLDRQIRDGLDQDEIEREVAKRVHAATVKKVKPPLLANMRTDITERTVRAAKRKRARTIVDGVFAKQYTGNDTIVASWRRETPRSPKGGLCWDVHGLLPIMYRFLTRIEAENAKRTEMNQGVANAGRRPKYRLLRTFSLLPTKRGFAASYVKFDSTGLLAMIKRNRDKVDFAQTVEHEGRSWTLHECMRKKTADEASAPFVVTSHLWWGRFFNIDSLENGESTFHREITTDGYGVSVLPSRPTRHDRKAKKTERKKEGVDSDGATFALGPKLYRHPRLDSRDSYGVIWGIEPGRTDFVTATSSDGRTMRFRSTAYRSASELDKSMRQRGREISRTPGMVEMLQQVPTKKTASTATLERHSTFLFKNLIKLLTFFMRPIFRKLAFRSFTQRNRVLDRACAELAASDGDKPTLVAIGDCGAACASAIKNCPAGPVQLLCKKLTNMCEVVAVDEYLTSQIHHDCTSSSPLTNQFERRKYRDGKSRWCSVHRVLDCLRKGGGCGRSVGREVNASKNILDVALSQLGGSSERPTRLRRTPCS